MASILDLMIGESGGLADVALHIDLWKKKKPFLIFILALSVHLFFFKWAKEEAIWALMNVSIQNKVEFTRSSAYALNISAENP